MGTKANAETLRITCPPEHKHNSTCYTSHRCRCETCREWNREYARNFRKQRAYGRPTTTLVDATPARRHANMLRASGMGQERIAELAGIPQHVMRSLLYGVYQKDPVKRIRKESADGILAVLPDPELMIRRDPRGTRRRLQALSVQGWSHTAVAHLLGVHPFVIHNVLHKVAWVTQETHEKVRSLYEELWNTEPPTGTRWERQSVAMAKAHATRNGWLPSLAWDDIDNDDEPPTPPEPEPRYLLSVEEREDIVREWHAKRLSDRRIAEMTGIPDRTVLRIRHRLGLAAWTKEQQEAA